MVECLPNIHETLGPSLEQFKKKIFVSLGTNIVVSFGWAISMLLHWWCAFQDGGGHQDCSWCCLLLLSNTSLMKRKQISSGYHQQKRRPWARIALSWLRYSDNDGTCNWLDKSTTTELHLTLGPEFVDSPETAYFFVLVRTHMVLVCLPLRSLTTVFEDIFFSLNMCKLIFSVAFILYQK